MTELLLTLWSATTSRFHFEPPHMFGKDENEGYREPEPASRKEAQKSGLFGEEEAVE